jgi:hypothetical protein
MSTGARPFRGTAGPRIAGDQRRANGPRDSDSRSSGWPHSNPVQVMAFNAAEVWLRDLEEVADRAGGGHLTHRGSRGPAVAVGIGSPWRATCGCFGAGVGNLVGR